MFFHFFATLRCSWVCFLAALRYGHEVFSCFPFAPPLQLVEGPSVKQLDGRIHPIIVHFGSDDCADVEWLEFFV
jgi:hypothetical protein